MRVYLYIFIVGSVYDIHEFVRFNVYYIYYVSIYVYYIRILYITNDMFVYEAVRPTVPDLRIT